MCAIVEGDLFRSARSFFFFLLLSPRISCLKIEIFVGKKSFSGRAPEEEKKKKKKKTKKQKVKTCFFFEKKKKHGREYVGYGIFLHKKWVLKVPVEDTPDCSTSYKVSTFFIAAVPQT